MNRRTLHYDHVPLRGHPGFTLIELMVAMVLGLLIIVGVLSVFLANKQTYGRSEDLSLYQEKARFVSDLLTQDIRQADGTPCRKRDSTYTINPETDLDLEDDLGLGGETVSRATRAIQTARYPMKSLLAPGLPTG